MIECKVCNIKFKSELAFIEHNSTLKHHIRLDIKNRGLLTQHFCQFCGIETISITDYSKHIDTKDHKENKGLFMINMADISSTLRIDSNDVQRKRISCLDKAESPKANDFNNEPFKINDEFVKFEASIPITMPYENKRVDLSQTGWHAKPYEYAHQATSPFVSTGPRTRMPLISGTPSTSRIRSEIVGLHHNASKWYGNKNERHRMDSPRETRFRESDVDRRYRNDNTLTDYRRSEDRERRRIKNRDRNTRRSEDRDRTRRSDEASRSTNDNRRRLESKQAKSSMRIDQAKTVPQTKPIVDPKAKLNQEFQNMKAVQMSLTSKETDLPVRKDPFSNQSNNQHSETPQESSVKDKSTTIPIDPKQSKPAQDSQKSTIDLHAPHPKDPKEHIDKQAQKMFHSYRSELAKEMFNRRHEEFPDRFMFRRTISAKESMSSAPAIDLVTDDADSAWNDSRKGLKRAASDQKNDDFQYMTTIMQNNPGLSVEEVVSILNDFQDVPSTSKTLPNDLNVVATSNSLPSSNVTQCESNVTQYEPKKIKTELVDDFLTSQSLHLQNTLVTPSQLITKLEYNLEELADASSSNPISQHFLLVPSSSFKESQLPISSSVEYLLKENSVQQKKFITDKGKLKEVEKQASTDELKELVRKSRVLEKQIKQEDLEIDKLESELKNRKEARTKKQRELDRFKNKLDKICNI